MRISVLGQENASEFMPDVNLLEEVINRPKRGKCERRAALEKDFENYSIIKNNSHLVLIKSYHVPDVIELERRKWRKLNQLQSDMKIVEARMWVAKNKLIDYLAKIGHEIEIKREMRYCNCPANLEDLLYNKTGIVLLAEEDLARTYLNSQNQLAKRLKPEPKPEQESEGDWWDD